MGENTVMVVDDHEDSLEFVRALLELGGYEVAAFVDATSALNALRQMPPPCVIVVDLWMPSVDGPAFIRELKRDPRLAALPVILTSGAHQQAMRLGLPFLLKPIDSDALLVAVREHGRTALGGPPS